MNADQLQPQPQAGPSRPPTPPPPPIYFPPFPPPAPTPVSGTQDLLTRYHLLPYYAHYARPFLTPVTPVSSDRKRKRDAGKEVKFVGIVEPVRPDGTPRGGTPVGLDRMDVDEPEGKGKERETTVKIEEPDAVTGKGKDKEKERPKDKGKGMEKTATSTSVPGPSNLASTPGGKKKMKRDKDKSSMPKVKHGYRHYLWGRVNTKKDRFLLNLIQAPAKQQLHVKPLEQKTLRDAFNLKEGVLPDYDPLRYTDSPLISEKKKRKLAERAARLAARERAKSARSAGATAAPSAVPPMTSKVASTSAHPAISATVHVPIGGGVPTPATTNAGTPPTTPGSPLPGTTGPPVAGRKLIGSSGLKRAHVPGSPSRASLTAGGSPFPKVSSPMPQVSSPLRQAAPGTSTTVVRPSGLATSTSQPRTTGAGPAKPVVRPSGVGEKRKEAPGELEGERDRQRAKKTVPSGIPGVGKGGKKRKVNGATA
ncbi:hypothetical protein DACRYDRAFT_13875 [Dacryopinax primogenitus]|uniref:Uncharacterized protein n=1 Tax=Dacryopinax primogenitus (strain DJM 731) TaxID=1858805 RepID=M5G929_DACPD|nr:uncharacterized protein DACRYDRAFT_13875 [Dacryopinax primogenitus]EJU04680.1 hypothetical protein DACRYDRAFT_13875 [Dacryopinax primogenitus]